VQVRLTRNWGWSINPGYSRNSRLAQSPGATGSLAYNSIHVSSGFHRNLGRYTDLSFHYSSHEQWSSATNPSGINTGSSYLRHTFGISMSWHPERVVWD